MVDRVPSCMENGVCFRWIWLCPQIGPRKHNSLSRVQKKNVHHCILFVLYLIFIYTSLQACTHKRVNTCAIHRNTMHIYTYIHVCVCVSVCLSVGRPACLPVCLSIYLSVCACKKALASWSLKAHSLLRSKGSCGYTLRLLRRKMSRNYRNHSSVSIPHC